MKFYLSVLIIILLSFQNLSGQGGLDHIKNQKYMIHYKANPFNCDTIPDSLFSSLTLKICANLKLTESDLILIQYYDSLKSEMQTFGGKKLVLNFDSVQSAWRNYRDIHCRVIWDYYEGCSFCNDRATHYMTEMRKLTDIRISEIIKLIDIYRKKQEIKINE